jgi:hypothetical protein
MLIVYATNPAGSCHLTPFVLDGVEYIRGFQHALTLVVIADGGVPAWRIDGGEILSEALVTTKERPKPLMRRQPRQRLVGVLEAEGVGKSEALLYVEIAPFGSIVIAEILSNHKRVEAVLAIVADPVILRLGETVNGTTEFSLVVVEQFLFDPQLVHSTLGGKPVSVLEIELRHELFF